MFKIINEECNPHKYFIITSVIKRQPSEYKSPPVYANVVTEKMKENPDSCKIFTKIDYVMAEMNAVKGISKKNLKVGQYAKEYSKYLIDGIPINVEHYINMIKNPISKIFLDQAPKCDLSKLSESEKTKKLEHMRTYVWDKLFLTRDIKNAIINRKNSIFQNESKNSIVKFCSKSKLCACSNPSLSNSKYCQECKTLSEPERQIKISMKYISLNDNVRKWEEKNAKCWTGCMRECPQTWRNASTCMDFDCSNLSKRIVTGRKVTQAQIVLSEFEKNVSLDW
jgi:hypothetical protein